MADDVPVGPANGATAAPGASAAPVASDAGAASRRADAPPERLRPLRPVADGAVDLPAEVGAKAWAVLRRAPRGIRGEVPRVGGAAELCLDRRPARTLQFRVTAVPERAIEFPPRGIVEIDARRDAVVLPIAGGLAGPAIVTFELLDSAGAGTGAVVALAVEVESFADAAEPSVFLVPGGLADEGPGCCGRSATSVTGLRGMSTGTLRIGRTPFRDATRRATEIQVVVSDPAGVIRAMPERITIPAGETRSSPVAVDLGDAVGDAKITFRAGESECSLDVRSVAPAWRAPDVLVLPAGARALLDVEVATRPARMEGLAASSAQPEIAAVAAPTDPGRAPMSVLLPVVGGGPGETEVRISANGFPAVSTRVVTVATETDHSGGVLRLLGIPKGARGRITLRLPGGASFAAVPDDFVLPKGAAAVTGWGTATLAISVAADDPAAQIEIPARIEGAALPLLITVADEVRTPRRARHTIEAR